MTEPLVPAKPHDGGPWRGPTTEEWVARIARYALNAGETLPLVKPTERLWTPKVTEEAR
jgi:hypothetical protein